MTVVATAPQRRHQPPQWGRMACAAGIGALAMFSVVSLVNDTSASRVTLETETSQTADAASSGAVAFGPSAALPHDAVVFGDLGVAVRPAATTTATTHGQVVDDVFHIVIELTGTYDSSTAQVTHLTSGPVIAHTAAGPVAGMIGTSNGSLGSTYGLMAVALDSPIPTPVVLTTTDNRTVVALMVEADDNAHDSLRYAVSGTTLRQLAERVAHHQTLKRATLGVRVREQDGKLIASDSTTDRTTLLAGDVIERIESDSVHTASELNGALSNVFAGDTITVGVTRGSQRLSVRLTTPG